MFRSLSFSPHANVIQPVGTGTVEAAKEVTKRLVENGNVVSVGYMLRYLRCVQKMKQIIHDNNLTVMATNARYVSWESYKKGQAEHAVLCVRSYRQTCLVE
jgi:hypothetical protein